jgi:hypothetical protein
VSQKNWLEHAQDFARSRGFTDPVALLEQDQAPLLEATPPARPTTPENRLETQSGSSWAQGSAKGVPKLEEATEPTFTPRPLLLVFWEQWSQAARDLEPHRAALGNYWRLLVCLVALSRAFNQKAIDRPQAEVSFMLPACLVARAMGVSTKVLERLLSGTYGYGGSLKDLTAERRSQRLALFLRFVGWKAWTSTVSSKDGGQRNLHGGTVWCVRATPRPEGERVLLYSDYFKADYRDLEHDIEFGATANAQLRGAVPIGLVDVEGSETRAAHQKALRGVCRDSSSPTKKEVELSIQFIQKALTRLLAKSVEEFESLQDGRSDEIRVSDEEFAATWEVQTALEANVKRGHAGRKVWVDGVVNAVVNALDDHNSVSLKAWRRAAWVVRKLETHGLGEASRTAKAVLWGGVWETFLAAKERKIRSRGALARSIMLANGWRELEEMASSLKAGSVL